MTQEQKELLIKDLCARLPYGVKCKYYDCCEGDYDEGTICGFERQEYIQIDGVCIYVEEVKPYLLPISSMTEEQKRDYYSLADDVTIKPGQGSYFGIKIHCIKLGISDNPHEGVWDDVDLDAIDWLNKNHFDYRGLIPMGLAIDATGLNIY